jgi:hypothetical protein
LQDFNAFKNHQSMPPNDPLKKFQNCTTSLKPPLHAPNLASSNELETHGDAW